MFFAHFSPNVLSKGVPSLGRLALWEESKSTWFDWDNRCCRVVRLQPRVVMERMNKIFKYVFAGFDRLSRVIASHLMKVVGQGQGGQNKAVASWRFLEMCVEGGFSSHCSFDIIFLLSVGLLDKRMTLITPHLLFLPRYSYWWVGGW